MKEHNIDDVAKLAGLRSIHLWMAIFWAIAACPFLYQMVVEAKLYIEAGESGSFSNIFLFMAPASVLVVAMIHSIQEMKAPSLAETLTERLEGKALGLLAMVVMFLILTTFVIGFIQMYSKTNFDFQSIQRGIDYKNSPRAAFDAFRKADLSGEKMDCKIVNNSDLIQIIFETGYQPYQCSSEIEAQRELSCANAAREIIERLIKTNIYHPFYTSFWDTCEKEFVKFAKDVNSTYRLPNGNTSFITLEQWNGGTILVAPSAINTISGAKIEDIPIWMLKISSKTDSYRLYFGREDAYKKALNDFSTL